MSLLTSRSVTIEVEVSITQLLSRCKSFSNQRLAAHYHSKSEAYVKMLLI